jgi:hypothetical protein
MEVLVALALFLFAFAALGQLISASGDRALAIQHQSEAARLCQSKMAEVIVGAVPLSSVDAASFDEAPDFSWSMTAEQNGSVTGLWNVTVKVTREGAGGSKNVAELTQMVLDPSLRGSSFDTVTVPPGSSGGGGRGGGGGGGGQGATASAGASGGATAATKGGASTPAAAKGAATPTPAPSKGATPTPAPAGKGAAAAPAKGK